MNKHTILFLGEHKNPLFSWLNTQHHRILYSRDPITPNDIQNQLVDFIVSYGYRHIIKPDIIGLFRDRIINLHISYLPWNKGADPNLWSFLENTPKGVTIHHIDSGLDTGDIIVQKQVNLDHCQTLAESYDYLQIEIQNLFKTYWPQILSGSSPRTPQTTAGSSHKSQDKKELMSCLPLGWHTPIQHVIETWEKINAATPK